MYAHQHGPGEAGEFGDLYLRYRTRLVRYCGRRLGHDSEAEDAAQEALLRALQAWSRFDRTADPWPWLATIAARVCADMRRRSARPVAAEGQGLGTDVHDQAVVRLRASIIDDALDGLPARYRNPLVLKEYAGWSYRDIAQLEGTSVASVRSNIMRSRRHLGARVEAVARTRGQWPLPAAVPSVAGRMRERWRTWRHVGARWRRGLSRMVDPATVMTGLVLAMQPLGASAAAGGAVAGAAVIAMVAPVASSAGTVSVTGLLPEATVGSAGDISVPTGSLPPTPSAPAPTRAVGDIASSRETLTRIDAPSGPIRPTSVSIAASAHVQTSQKAMWVRTEVEVHTPLHDERLWRQTNLPCGPSDDGLKRSACAAASDVLRPLPGG